MTLSSANEIVFLDFEFIVEPGERPQPVCMVAIEQRSGRVFREFLEPSRLGKPPFATGLRRDCHRLLRFSGTRLLSGARLAFSGISAGPVCRIPPCYQRSFGAARTRAARGDAWYGLDGIEASEKDRLRKRILAGGPYPEPERKAILDYCESDVRALAELCPRILESRDCLTLPLLRGEFMKAVALAEFLGVPIDASLYRRMCDHWPRLQSAVIDKVNALAPVFDGNHFRSNLFEAWLVGQGIDAEWPRTRTGALALDEDTFRDMSALYPQTEPLWRARQMLGQMRKPELSVGADGRNRSCFRRSE